jgi:alkylation response protein AidB-like acyl-CoA dehydrogenase
VECPPPEPEAFAPGRRLALSTRCGGGGQRNRDVGPHRDAFRDVFVPGAHLLDSRPAGGPIGQHPAAAAWVAVLLPAVYLGVAEAARDWLVGWLRECVPCSLGHPLSELQRSQDVVGHIEALLYAADRVFEGAAAESDANLERSGEIASGCVTVTASAIRAIECAMSLAGNASLSRRNPFERHLRDALCGRAQWPQDDYVFRRSGQQVLQGDA